MQSKLFKSAKRGRLCTKRSLSFNDYLQETLTTATRIQEISPGEQRYFSAQL